MRLVTCVLALALSGCGTPSKREAPPDAPARGGYYKDDGPGEHPPADLAAIPDAEPRVEPLHRFANRPYQVFGRDYVPLAAVVGAFRERGVASWYGKRFHGGTTSSGERYDMYAMTAAHPTLPVPSYVRVTNVATGRSVVVRVNDRGPFHANRIIDLSYAAAYRLGAVEPGSTLVEIEAIVPGGAMLAAAPLAAARAAERAAPAAETEAKGVYLQLGAFAVRENAESFRARMMREFAWLPDAIQVIAGETLFRLHLGPYRSQDEARAIADRIRSQISLSPVLVVR